MKGRILVLVGLLLTAAALVSFGARAGFNSGFSDPAGDTSNIGNPPQGMKDSADVISGTSSADATTITLTLTFVGTIGYSGVTLLYTFSTHGGDATSGLLIDGTTLTCISCSYSYDYTSTGGGSDFALVDPVVSGTTLTVSVPLVWGGAEGTYLLTFTTYLYSSDFSQVSSDDGGQVNQAPAIQDGPGSTVNRDVGTSFTYDFNAVDPDGDALTWLVSSTPTAAWLTIDPGTGVLTGTPPVVGNWDVVVEVSDPYSNTDSYTFTLNGVTCGGNTAPTITNEVTGQQTVSPGNPYTHDYAATDPDGDGLEWTVAGSNYATINRDTGVLAFASPILGTYTLTVTVTDSCGNVDTSAVTIVVSNTGGGTTKVDPRTTTTGRTTAITIAVTKNQVTWSRTGNQVTLNYLTEGTTTGTVDHLKSFLITEYRNGSHEISDSQIEVPDGSFEGLSFGFHGTGTGGSRATWHHHISGTVPARPGDPNDVNDPNFRRVVACYMAYTDTSESQWNFACVVVIGEGQGNTGAGDQTTGTVQSVGGGLGLPVILAIVIIVVVVALLVAVVFMRRRKPQAPAPPPPPA